ncbi:hypothetical protein ACFLW2_01935 [Chloroflexota bacterium]
MTEDSTVTQAPGDREAILHLKQSILDGKQWYIALLEAVGLWASAEEIYEGHTYRYLIGGEAFDWLLLAERLCAEADGIIPEEEKVALLFFAKPPVELPKKDFKELLGEAKYQAYLNYHYGVVIEEALILTVEEEVCKEQRSSAIYVENNTQQKAYQRVYGTDKLTLLHQFRQERDYPHDEATTLTEHKEFTYWLFKYRLKQCEPARIASDTKKALRYLEHQWAARREKDPAGHRMDIPGC